jgi:hypothetical protein
MAGAFTASAATFATYREAFDRFDGACARGRSHATAGLATPQGS